MTTTNYRLVVVPDTFHPDGRVTRGFAPLAGHITSLRAERQRTWTALCELVGEVVKESRRFTVVEEARYRELQARLDIVEGQLGRAMVRLRAR